MIIDIQAEILRKNFTFSQDSRVIPYKDTLTEEEIEKVTSYTDRYMTDIISQIKCDDTNILPIMLETQKIERRLEKKELSEKVLSSRAYDKLFYFLRGNQSEESHSKIIAEMTKSLDVFESTAEKIDAISELTKLTCDYCIKTFKEDLDNYIKRKPLTKRLDSLSRIDEVEVAAEEVKSWQDRVQTTPRTVTPSPSPKSSPESQERTN